MDRILESYIRFAERHWAIILDMGILITVGGGFFLQMTATPKAGEAWWFLGSLLGLLLALGLFALPPILMFLWMVPQNIYRLNKEWYRRNIKGE